ncbi:hypothetical protein ACFQ0G_29190 [Streptomyces chiangmaiensis]
MLRPAGLLLSTRPYDDLLRNRPASTPPQVHRPADGVNGPSPSSSGTGTRTANTTTWSTSNYIRPAENGASRSAGPSTGRSAETGWPAS